MSITALESSRRYQDRNRAKVNQQSRERYEAKKVLPNPPRLDVANLRRVAFLDALDEIGDDLLRDQLGDMVNAMAALLVERGGLKEYAARNQANEFIAACVWGQVNAPRKVKK